ncbi:MAG TPA: ABC transporter substrate-binding protein [Burkholderiales bacterium]|nr:ABC transporter substrate-binding protein [Burkholderiales bacterium]
MIRIILSVVFAFLAQAALPQDLAPDVLVKNVTQDVISIVKQDKDIQAGNQKKTIALVEEKVLPHFNFGHMTALAMGQNWRKATPEQQGQLVEQFRTLLVRTYSTALSSYRNQVIDFKPLRSQPSDTDVMVRSEVKQPGAEPVSIDYSLEKTSNSWKVYDVIVGGVSLVTTYRDTFASEVRASGIDGLIKALSEKNRQLAAKTS